MIPSRFLPLSLFLILFAASPAISAEVHFSYQPSASTPSQVSVAGEFNSWNADANVMTDADGDGLYEATLDIPPGRYEYKFVVDGTWYENPLAAEQVSDPYGGKNSVLTVEEGAASVESPKGAAPFEKAAPLKMELTGEEVKVHFSFTPPVADGRLVTVAGEWNSWHAGTDYLTDDDGDGTWEGEVLIAPGRYEYKFVVDNVWFADPDAPEQVTNDMGNENSVLEVPAGVGSFDASVREVPLKRYTIGVKEGAGSPGGTDLRSVPFRYTPEGSAGAVYLAGTFNEWNPTGQLMQGPDEAGLFSLNLPLTPGEYQYKFVVDGTGWYHDPDNEETTDDGHGGSNSIIVVDERFPSVAIEPGDGKIREEGLSFSSSVVLTRSAGDRAALSVRAFRNDVDSVTVLFTADGGKEEKIQLHSQGEDGQYIYLQGEFGLADDGDLAVLYHDGIVTRALADDGLLDPADAPPLRVERESIPLSTIPDWVADGVFYQIFPDRFFNGNRDNDPDFSEYYYDGLTDLPASGKTNGEYFHLVEDWNEFEGLKKSPYRTDGRPDYYSFYGGDFQGVIKKLDYLVDLGVTIIYFNPVHQAQSNHKYDAVDYGKADPHFGGDDGFRKLASEAHKRGMKIVIDGVFNHTGMYHKAFLDTKEKGDQSEYWSWYDWRRWPLPDDMGSDDNWSDYYSCWWGFGSLPNLNFDLSRPDEEESGVLSMEDAEPNRELVDHILDVARHWMKDLDADGFRLDVPNEVPPWFWRLFREAVRESREDGGFIWAELWGNAAADLGPNGFDAVMNYKYFLEPALAFIGKGSIDAGTFDTQLAAGRFSYTPAAVLGAMNLIGSHDTERFLTRAGRDTRRLMLAASFGATYVGVPHIYYGDEIGMEGGKDPDCRRPFRWDEIDNPGRAKVLDHYRKVFGIRKEHPALRRGNFQTLLAEEKVFAFTRSLEGDKLAVLMNAGSGPVEISLDAGALPFEAKGAKDLLSGNSYPLRDSPALIAIEPFGTVILHLK